MAKKFTHQKKAVKKAGIQKRHTFKSAAQLVKSKHVSTLASTSTGLDFSVELDVRLGVRARPVSNGSGAESLPAESSPTSPFPPRPLRPPRSLLLA